MHSYLSGWKFFDLINNAPNGKQGFYCKLSQKKRRKNQRRIGKRR